MSPSPTASAIREDSGGFKSVFETKKKYIPEPKTPSGAGNVKMRNPFTDVYIDDWYYQDVMYTYSKGLLKGTFRRLFEPGTAVSRGMLVTILYRDAGSPKTAGLKNPFSDLSAGVYYYEPVIWAAANGIVYGGDDGLFRPEDLVTRQQLAAVLFRYAVYAGFDVFDKDADLSPDAVFRELAAHFIDADQFFSYAWKPILALVKSKIVIGDFERRFKPDDPLTRAQAAAVIHRYHGITVADERLN